MKFQNKFWYKLLSYLFKLLPYLLVNLTFKIILLQTQLRQFSQCLRSALPLGQKRLEMAHELRRVRFKLWVIKSCSCFLHSPRSHVRDVVEFWRLTSPIFTMLLVSFFGFQENAFLTRKCSFVTSKTLLGRVRFLAKWWFSEKCDFDSKKCWNNTPKTHPEGSTFWWDGWGVVKPYQGLLYETRPLTEFFWHLFNLLLPFLPVLSTPEC